MAYDNPILAVCCLKMCPARTGIFILYGKMAASVDMRRNTLRYGALHGLCSLPIPGAVIATTCAFDFVCLIGEKLFKLFMDTQDIAFRVVEPGGLLGTQHANMIHGLETR